MKDPQRDRIVAAFDREFARSPFAPELRAQTVHNAVSSSNAFGRKRQPKTLALVAALLAIAIVATLVFAARSLHSTPVVPANSVPLPKAGALAPGPYFLANPNNDDKGYCSTPCSGYQRIYFTLPAGWATSNGLVYKHLNQPGEVAFSAWTVDQVYADPCHWQRSALSELELWHQSHASNGAIVPAPYEGGLANQALRGPLPRALTPVTLASVWSGVIGRVMALRIDLSVPAGLDISRCDEGEFRSWPLAEHQPQNNTQVPFRPDGGNSHHASGQLDAVYMVDVDRLPLVIDASHMPATSVADLAELKAILASMIIDRG